MFLSDHNKIVSTASKTVVMLTTLFLAVCSTSSFASTSHYGFCGAVSKRISSFDVASGKSLELASKYLTNLKNGEVLDFVEVDSDLGKRFLMADMILPSWLKLREGRTQTVDFNDLKRLPRTGTRLDYLVVASDIRQVTEARVSKLGEKSVFMGVRFFPIATGDTKTDRLLLRLATLSRGTMIDISAAVDSCNLPSLPAETADVPRLEMPLKSTQGSSINTYYIPKGRVI